MSIEVNQTVDFFYLGGVVQGISHIHHPIIGSLSIGLMGVVAAINLRDRLIRQTERSHYVSTLSSLAVEVLQIASGILTGTGAQLLYRASMQANFSLGSLGIAAIFIGASLSFGSLSIQTIAQNIFCQNK